LYQLSYLASQLAVLMIISRRRKPESEMLFLATLRVNGPFWSLRRVRQQISHGELISRSVGMVCNFRFSVLPPNPVPRTLPGWLLQ
ncbi:MAG TPA: hypothetical protein DDW52_28890, partial [Planctomycetaceae bacterium]|nr:hypothetical protein [Planctomycetaceae bacterium]